MIMRSYYEFAQIPHQIVRTASGEEIAILDRRGWLHMHVFDAKSDPDTFFKVGMSVFHCTPRCA